MEWELQCQTVDKQKVVVVLPQGYNQDPQQSVKHILLEDNCSWEGWETQHCSLALKQVEVVGVVEAQHSGGERGEGKGGRECSGCYSWNAGKSHCNWQYIPERGGPSEEWWLDDSHSYYLSS